MSIEAKTRKPKPPLRADLTEIKADSLIRISDVLQFVRVGRSSWYRGVKLKLYPEGVLVGPRTRMYRGKDILKLING